MDLEKLDGTDASEISFDSPEEAVEDIESSYGIDDIAKEAESKRAVAQLVLDIEYDLDGEDPKYLVSLLHQAARHMISNGMITGDTRATVVRHDIHVDMLDDDSQLLDEGDLADFYADRIENGAISLENLPRMLARRALMRPLEAKGMVWQQMRELGMIDDEDDDDDGADADADADSSPSPSA